jgi:EF-P beta-lysylation protein EpmB
MIQNSTVFPQRNDWKLALAQSFRNIPDLLDFLHIPADQALSPASKQFPLRVTRFYASLIEQGNIDDPLLKQVLPSAQELVMTPGYSRDAVGDNAAVVAPGLIHKYPSRVLLTLTGACAIHCRYCFRRHFPYADNLPELDIDGPALEYIGSHDELREVILSGGDPLMLSDEKIARLVNALNGIPHINTLRIHSRLASVLPQRLDDALAEILLAFRGTTVLVTHINHPNELCNENGAALRGFARQGIRLFNQSVLLKGVNDDEATLAGLSYKLFEFGITPYYLHCLDKVQGAAHFDLERATACRLHTRLQSQLAGYLMPRLVEEIPGRASKTQVQCN